MLRQIVSPTLRLLGQRSSSTRNGLTRKYHVGEHKGPTMDDLPVPAGSWESQYKSNQTKYNLHLAMGIIFCAASITTAKASGHLYFNYSPPPLPEN